MKGIHLCLNNLDGMSLHLNDDYNTSIKPKKLTTLAIMPPQLSILHVELQPVCNSISNFGHWPSPFTL